MTEVVLTYIGSVLIAMEFVRKFTDLLALMGMLVGWPVSQYMSEDGLIGLSKAYKFSKLKVIARLILSLILAVLTLPLTVVFYLIWLIILVLNSFHNRVNAFYSEGKKRYHDIYMFMIRYALAAMYGKKKIVGINEQKVMKHIEKQEIPILPIIGIILITIAFVIEIKR